MSVLHTISELIGAVPGTYGSVDVRSVAIREADVWVNVMTVLRLTYEDVPTAQARVLKQMQRFRPVQTETLRRGASEDPPAQG